MDIFKDVSNSSGFLGIYSTIRYFISIIANSLFAIRIAFYLLV
jgi:hypothetical protein